MDGWVNFPLYAVNQFLGKKPIHSFFYLVKQPIHFYSSNYYDSVRSKVRIPDHLAIFSTTAIWKANIWHKFQFMNG